MVAWFCTIGIGNRDENVITCRPTIYWLDEKSGLLKRWKDSQKISLNPAVAYVGTDSRKFNSNNI